MSALLRSRRIVAVLALAALHMLVFDRGMGGDGWAGFALLESIADDGDLWVEDDHRGIVNGLVPGRDGHLVSQYPPGILLLDALPFFAGRLLAPRSGGEADLSPVGRVPLKVFLSAAAIVAARNAVTLLGLAWIALALLRLGYGEPTAAAATALAFFGGPMAFYSLVGMTHAPTFALASLLLWLLVRQREAGSLALAFAAGAVVGLAVLVRYGAVALLPAALLAVSGGSRIKPRLALLAGFGIPLALLPFWWKASFGAWGIPPYGGDWTLSPASPWNVLFHPVHGLFLFHPVLLFAAAGLALPGWSAGRAGRRTAWGAVGAIWFLAIAFLHGGWSEWANPGGFGQRFLIDALPALALGLAELLERAPSSRALRAGLAGAALFGYLLFFAAVGRLVEPPAPWPWPQRLGDYAPILREPPGPSDLRNGLLRASFLLRALA